MPTKLKTADQQMETANRFIGKAQRAAAVPTNAAHRLAPSGRRGECRAGCRNGAVHVVLGIEPKLHKAEQLLSTAPFAVRNVEERQSA